MGYQEEKQKIFDEMIQKSKLIDQEEDEAWKSGKIRGLDDSFSLKQKKVTQEYNRRLRELKEKYKEDFLRVSDGYEYEEFKKRHKDENVKFSDFDEEMRIHMNNLIKTKPENPQIHTDVYKNTMKTSKH